MSYKTIQMDVFLGEIAITPAVVNTGMPLGNKTAMSDVERARLGKWAGARK